jgi:hypothetical protein
MKNPKTDDPKTEVAAVVRGEPAAEGRAAVRRVVVPRTATKHTIFVVDVLHGCIRHLLV